MNRTWIAPLLLSVALGLGACASPGPGMLSSDAPRALPQDGPVSVSWADPATFSEFRASGNRQAAAQGAWLQDLARYLRSQTARRLPPGDTLQLTILDVQRAGRYEPWRDIRMQDTRIVRDIYPPRMTLRFRQFDAGGNLVAEGERKLVDPAFLLTVPPGGDSDPLRFEKGMVDAWVRREFPVVRAPG